MEVNITTTNIKCEKCGNTREENVIWRGFCKSGKRFQCRCGAWGHTQESQGNYSYSSNGETAEYVVTTEKRIVSEKDIIELIHLDTAVWRILEFKIGTNEAHRKARQVNLRWEDGRIVEGEVHDDGKMLVVPLHTIRVRVVRKTQEIRNNLAVEDLINDAKKFAPKYKKIHYPKLKDGMLYEVEMVDLHIGRLAWGLETGQDSDLKLQMERVETTLEKLLSYTKNYPIEKIIIPIGQDFYNSDNQRNETTGGTPQQEDSRWRLTYHRGRQLAVKMIDMCSSVAPVEVIHVPGNHSEEREWCLCDALECWYHSNPNVTIDNSPKKRKYVKYGNVLIGMTHGSDEKLERLPLIMPTEAPGMWASTKYHEWHVGHFHHKKDTLYKTDEINGVMVRILRSLASPDDWHYDKGFIGAQQSSEAFLWDKNSGLVAQFSATF